MRRQALQVSYTSAAAARARGGVLPKQWIACERQQPELRARLRNRAMEFELPRVTYDGLVVPRVDRGQLRLGVWRVPAVARNDAGHPARM